MSADGLHTGSSPPTRAAGHPDRAAGGGAAAGAAHQLGLRRCRRRRTVHQRAPSPFELAPDSKQKADGMKDDELREIIAGHGGSLDGTADRPKLQQRAQEVVESLSRRLNDARQCTRYVQDIEVAQQNAVALRELLRDRPTRATAVGALLADRTRPAARQRRARADGLAGDARRPVRVPRRVWRRVGRVTRPPRRPRVDAARPRHAQPRPVRDQQSGDDTRRQPLLRACAPAIGGNMVRRGRSSSRRVEYAVNIAQPDLDAATALGFAPLARRRRRRVLVRRINERAGGRERAPPEWRPPRRADRRAPGEATLLMVKRRAAGRREAAAVASSTRMQAAKAGARPR